MTTMTAEDVRVWQDSVVVDRDGHKVGKIEDVYYDEATGRPEWALVNTGLFGRKHNFVPVTGDVKPTDGRVMVQWTEQQIKDAPAIDSNEELSVQEERRLYDHYGLSTESSESASLYATPQGMGASAPMEQPGMTAPMGEMTEEERMGRSEGREYEAGDHGTEDYGTAGGGMESSTPQMAPPISRDVDTPESRMPGEDYSGSMQSTEGVSGTESYSSQDLRRPGELIRMRKTVIETEAVPSSAEHAAVEDQSRMGESRTGESRTGEEGRSDSDW